jgi:sigma-B regulation protein RsbU (phosphoserine phosphatase)
LLNILKQNSLVEKLSLQAESFQEGFETLIKCNSFEEIAKNFWHLLRGNFLVTNIILLHKTSINAEWKLTGSKTNIKKSDFNYLSHKNQLTIKYYKKKKFDVALVLPLSDSSYLGILLGHKLDGGVFTDFDKITLQILLQVFSSAYNYFLNQKKEKKLVFELNEKVLQLNNLIDTGIELSRFDKQNVLFELALERITSITNSSSALLIITNKVSGNIENQVTFPGQLSVEKILKNNLKIESSFEFNKKSYRFILSEKETRKGVTSFNELDELLLHAITKQVQASIENEFLLKQSLEKERIEKEISLAAAIQQTIIPKELPKIADYELAGINIPSREVGGDYYDCISLEEGIYALIMADVAGKGISAALLVSTLNAALYSYLEFNLPLAELADKLNKLIYKSSPPDKYITFFIAILDSSSGELSIVNAGHNPGLILRDNGALEKIEAGGTGLGMLDLGIPFAGQSLMLNKGDMLFLYTDGIPEAMNLKEEEYSDERMIEFLKNNSEKSPLDLSNSFVKDVRRHTSGADQSDDITLLVLKRSND